MRQDQKQTPNKYTSRSYRKRMIDEALSKDLLCPFLDTFSPGLFHAYTPMRKQPEYLLSPSPIKKDLFSQLLGTETKHNSPAHPSDDAIEEENMSMSGMSSEDDNSMIEECSDENEANWSDENGVKKRKRKSTAQIKLLKQQLDGEMNWTKEKITKMAEITGLSQSQVYKWCWDQKKKQNRGKEQQCRNMRDKRKLIKKNLNLRIFNDSKRAQEQESEDDNKQNLCEQSFTLANMRRTMTKPKVATGVTDAHETEKKVNKRLVFY